MHIKKNVTEERKFRDDTSTLFRIGTLCHSTGSDVWCGRPACWPLPLSYEQLSRVLGEIWFLDLFSEGKELDNGILNR